MFAVRILSKKALSVVLILLASSSLVLHVVADDADHAGCTTDVIDPKDTDDPDRVSSIPNYDGCICWKHYSGYLNATNDHKLFYWYHEAIGAEKPETKPLVLWLNGGPGCSSLGGMFTELGPFVVSDSNLNVELNPYSFNKVANMLFIEQPAGVGFSYPNVKANDTSTAIDTVEAIRYFLKYKHPELLETEFYVMGESYGGHYVPNTVKQIQETNRQLLLKGATSDQPIINIKGFAVGNGYTDWELDFNANVPNGRYHALTSQSLYEKAEKACDGDYARCFWPRPDIECPKECSEAVYDATVDAEDGSIDIYDIYNDVCLKPHQDRLETQLTTLLKYRREARIQEWVKNSDVDLADSSDSSSDAMSSSQRHLRATISPIYPTCIDSYTDKYLNLPEVQQAIHVMPDTIPNGRWKDCGNVNYKFNYESELDNYRQWVKDGNLNILIYNGDADYILSHMGNNAWITQGLQLNKTVDGEWKKWYGTDGQVAGYYEKYQTSGVPLTFLTIKGAGHMVPRDRPKHALDMFTMFVNSDNNGNYDEVYKNGVVEAEVQPLCHS